MNLTAQENSQGTAVEGVKHLFEDIERLEFIDQQRVFLLVGRVLYGLFEVIQLTKVLFPLIVNHIEQHTFLELPYRLFAMTLGSRLEVHGNVIHFLTVGDRDEDVFVHLSLGLIDILDLRIGDLHQFVHTAFEAIECGLSQLFTQHIAFAMMEGIFIERHLNREGLHHIVF